MLRYAITDRSHYEGNEQKRLDLVVDEAARWTAANIEFIQVREKDLEAGKLAELVRRVLAAAQTEDCRTKILVNSRADVAVAVGADGVHLTASPRELMPAQVRKIFAVAGLKVPTISISCHTIEEVSRASVSGVDAILFGPVFEKVTHNVRVTPGLGISSLQKACEMAGKTPVFALGGVTPERIAECADAGATGVAGIRLFRRA